MKRAILVGTGTVAGVAAVLALNPDGSTTAVGLTRPASAQAPTAVGPSTRSAAPSTTSGTTTTTTTATGSAVDVGYGTVQVQATLSGGRIVDIQALSLPQNDGHSAMISSQAFPMLVQQALSAQSSQIAGISGASYTSYGFEQSLRAALLSVGHAA